MTWFAACVSLLVECSPMPLGSEVTSELALESFRCPLPPWFSSTLLSPLKHLVDDRNGFFTETPKYVSVKI